jgi:hypothetical protein
MQEPTRPGSWEGRSVDGQTFEDIEEYGVKNWMGELMQE